MYVTTLAPQDIEVGKLVTEVLKARIPLQGSLWYYWPDSDEWRLVLATSLVDKQGPTAAYSAIQKAVRTLAPNFALPLRRISVVSPREPFIANLRAAFRGADLSGLRIKRSVVNDRFIEDAYIYQLRT